MASIDFGPLNRVMQDKSISEIMVNQFDRIYVEKSGNILETNLQFKDESSLQTLIKSLALANGIQLSLEQPFFDGRLGDGSRINAVLPPMSCDGANLTIRKFSSQPLNLNLLMDNNSITDKCGQFLDACVKARANMIISGGTSTGKTTFLNALSAQIPLAERIISIEDTPELQLQHPNWIRLESVRKAGKSVISIRDCLVNALRMRPDRIIVGECRRDETFEMLQAMNTGHDGSLTTIHSNSSVDCLNRLEALVSYSSDFPIDALRKHISQSIDLIIQLKRRRNGSRYLSDIIEITGMEQNTITTQSIFQISPKGELQATGLVPNIMEKILRIMPNFPKNFFFNK